jgi:hypothetical protein
MASGSIADQGTNERFLLAHALTVDGPNLLIHEGSIAVQQISGGLLGPASRVAAPAFAELVLFGRAPATYFV